MKNTEINGKVPQTGHGRQDTNGTERRNYERELERIIIENEGKRPTVLLHSCCGPCSSSVMEFLVQYFDLTLLWYNPNLYPQEEFDRRLDAQLELITKMGLADKVKVLVLPRQEEDYYSRIGGLENEREGGSRCAVCFRVRLETAARITAEKGFDFFCSTLTLSRHKNAVLINAIGEELAEKTGTRWLPSEFKKKGRELRSTQLCAENGIYRQNYCGCEFSMRRE